MTTVTLNNTCAGKLGVTLGDARLGALVAQALDMAKADSQLPNGTFVVLVAQMPERLADAALWSNGEICMVTENVKIDGTVYTRGAFIYDGYPAAELAIAKAENYDMLLLEGSDTPGDELSFGIKVIGEKRDD